VGLLGTVLLVAAGIAVIGFFSGSETGLYTINRFRLRQRAHRRERLAGVLSWLLSDPVGLLVTLLLGHNLAVYGVTALVTGAYERAGLSSAAGWWRHPDVAATLTLVVPLFIFAEVLPKNYFRRHAERLSYLAGPLLVATKFVLLPLVWPLRLAAGLVPSQHDPARGLGLPELSRRLIDHLLSRGRETGELTAEQELMARNVLRAGERRVAELARSLEAGCCTAESEGRREPASRTLAIGPDEIAGRVLQRLTEARARLALVLDDGGRGARPGAAAGLPVPGPKPPAPVVCRDVLGYVRLFDLLAPGVQGRPVRELARPVPRLRAHATLRAAFTVMQRECADVAIVESPGPRLRGALPLPAPGTGSGEPNCPVLGVVRLPQLIAELLQAPPEGAAGARPTADARR
jgi:hypothetical protein